MGTSRAYTRHSKGSTACVLNIGSIMCRNYPLLIVLTCFIAALSSAEIEEEYNFNQLQTLDLRTKQMRDLCPSGIDRCHCLNNAGNPDFCYCKDSPDVRRDSRPRELSAVMDLCPAGEMDRCLCHDNSVVHFPFDMATFFFNCRPKRCKCKGDKKAKKVTGLGCAKGGFPYCNAKTTDRNYFCKDGQRAWLKFLIQYQIDGRKDCFCKDNSLPRCINSGQPAQCPDGSLPDFKVYSADFLKECKKDDWEFGQAHQKFL